MDVINGICAEEKVSPASITIEVTESIGKMDGEYLKETIEGISEIEGSISIALVPVGLTKCKNPDLRIYTQAEAKDIIALTKRYQDYFLEKRDTRFVFCSDEFYVLAKEPVPEEDAYEYYPQIENGVGLIRQFTEDFIFSAEELCGFPKKQSIGLITGYHGSDALQEVLMECEKVENLKIRPIVVENKFFGSTVTVTGLLTGQDIIDTLKKEKEDGMIYFLPDVLLKHNTDLLLDGISVNDIRLKSGCDIRVVETSGTSLADAIAEIREELL